MDGGELEVRERALSLATRGSERESDDEQRTCPPLALFKAFACCS